MGILSYFDKDVRKKRAATKAVATANNKHMPKDYRRAGLSEVMDLARKGDPIAIQGLVARFAVFAEPTIEDEEEKEWVHEELVSIGESVVSALFKAVEGGAESVSWHLRTLERILPAEAYDQKLLDLIAAFDTEYERSPDRKIQVLTVLGGRSDPRVCAAVVRFLDDVDETVRFNAVKALAEHRDEVAFRLIPQVSAKKAIVAESRRCGLRIVMVAAQQTG